MLGVSKGMEASPGLPFFASGFEREKAQRPKYLAGSRTQLPSASQHEGSKTLSAAVAQSFSALNSLIGFKTICDWGLKFIESNITFMLQRCRVKHDLIKFLRLTPLIERRNAVRDVKTTN